MASLSTCIHPRPYSDVRFPHAGDRDYYDPLLDEAAASLLYFPTGGGKSEAFYGALLFAMFRDRLGGKARGVTAIIRYPLRLLTLQQGQRLLLLVTAAKLVRIDEAVGGLPFQIGFWVGGNNTPNRYSYVPGVIPLASDAAHPNDERLEEGVSGLDADEQRDATRYREFRAAYNKVPQCPSCGRPPVYAALRPMAQRRGALASFASMHNAASTALTQSGRRCHSCLPTIRFTHVHRLLFLERSTSRRC